MAVNVINIMSGQWRTGPGGPIALDYSLLDFAYRQARIPRSARRGVFEDVQVIEDEALKVIHDD